MGEKNRFHIAFFTNSYHPVMSGVVRSVSTFRSALSDLGHNVFVFAQYASDYQDTEPFIFRYPAIELPTHPDFPLAIPLSPFVDKLLPSLKLDVIHSHHPVLLGQAAATKAQSLNLPLVYTFHTQYREYSHYFSMMNQKFIKEQIDQWVADYMRKCHHIIAPSRSIKQLLEVRYGVTEQVTTIPTGIDLTPYQNADREQVRQELGWQDELVLISVSRLAKEKNWDTLLKAVALAIKDAPNIRFVVVGDGSERSALEQLAQSLGIGPGIEFVGKIPMDRVPAYLKGADIFCFASVTETQGLVTLEALAAGLPVAAVDADGTRDIVESGKQGLLTDNDSTALAGAIRSLIADENMRRTLSQHALARAAEYEVHRLARKMVRAYEQAKIDAQAQRYIRVSEVPQRTQFRRLFDDLNLPI